MNKTTQAIRAKAFDISEYYRQHWQGTGFKAQLVAPSKSAAIRFKEVLDEIGHVSSAVIISPPDDNEDNEEMDQESKDLVRVFWDTMMARYKTEDEYNRKLIEDFKGTGDPEILIVVSKLLTGFDAPRNTVLYICKPLKEHNLLQAIAHVNRLFETEEGGEKEFGVIIDYEGLLGELDKALTTYSAFEGYENADLAETVHDVREEIRRLCQLLSSIPELSRPDPAGKLGSVPLIQTGTVFLKRLHRGEDESQASRIYRAHIHRPVDNPGGKHSMGLQHGDERLEFPRLKGSVRSISLASGNQPVCFVSFVFVDVSSIKTSRANALLKKGCRRPVHSSRARATPGRCCSLAIRLFLWLRSSL